MGDPRDNHTCAVKLIIDNTIIITHKDQRLYLVCFNYPRYEIKYWTKFKTKEPDRMEGGSEEELL
jgi:hypothetical protein